MKKSILCLLLLVTGFPVYAQALQVPAEFERLLGSARERTLVGQTSSQNRCELVLEKRNHGFIIRARDYNSYGEQVPQKHAAVFTVTEFTNILDHWGDTFGMRYYVENYSSIASEYDRRLYLDFDRVSESETIVEARYFKGNGYFIYTYYKFRCEFLNLW